MTFLNIALLGGLVAASIPIIIHLLNRRRIRVVKWGAMHLLELTIKKHSRRLNIEQLILLLIRCLIPAVLALCLARPVLRSFQSLVGNSQSSTVVLLDNSYSMDYGGGARSTFQLARQVAAQKIAGLSRGSDAAIIPMAGGEAANSVTPSVDTVRLNQLLNQSEADGGKAAIPASLDIAGQLFGKMQHNFREILLVSDFQRINWSPAEAAARNRALDGLRKLPIPPHVTLFHVGAEGHDNVAVESLEFSRLIAGVNQPMQIRANLHNFGDKAWPELRVYFRVDGKERAASQISLSANEQRQLLFTHSFEAAGSHVVEVFADADSLKVDNVAQAAIPVWDKVPVLLVNGDPSSEPMRGETDFMEIALQPFGQGRVELADLITNRVILPNQLTPDALNAARVCVLANVERLTDDQLSQLSFFVREGGGLLIFPGNRCNTDWYNQSLKGAGLLPLSLSALRGSVNEGGAVGRVLAQHFTHPAMEIFNDPRNGNLADAEIRLWFKTGQPDNQNETISTLAQLDSGDPFLVEKKVGEGRVMFCSTACDADWSNLPTRPVYLPLMQRLATYLASSIFPPRNVEIGKPLIAFFPRSEIGKIVTLTDPAGKKHETKIEDRNNRGVFEFARTGLPGLYQLEAPDNSAIHFVVSASREESDLAQLTDGELQSLAKEMNADVANSWGEYKSLDHARRFGREFWKPLLWALLVLLFGELILQQWFARRRG